MSIFTKLFALLKVLLPILKSAAQKAYDQLPTEAQEQLKNVSRVVEAVKQLYVAGKDITANDVSNLSNVPVTEVERYLIAYAKSKGVDTDNVKTAIDWIKTETEGASKTGLKSLWTSLFHVIAEEFSHIDWRTLLMGVGQFVFDEYVKGKINI